MGLPGDISGKEPPANARDMGLIPGWGRSPAEGNGNPLQYSCLDNSMDRGAWWATVHGTTKDMTEQLSTCPFTLLLYFTILSLSKKRKKERNTLFLLFNLGSSYWHIFIPTWFFHWQCIIYWWAHQAHSLFPFLKKIIAFPRVFNLVFLSFCLYYPSVFACCLLVQSEPPTC